MKIGLGDITITPSLDTPLAGYYYPRRPRGIHDDLHAKALLIDKRNAQVVLVVCDLVMVPRDVVDYARERIQEECGIPPDHVLISANHSHTGPVMTPEYTRLLGRWIVDSVASALHRKVDASLFLGNEMERGLAFNRRYQMKDGTVVTNPGFLNPEVFGPVGPIDPRVGVLRATDAEGRPLMTWVNYAMHQDTIGGDLISADYSWFLAQTLARINGPDMVTIFTIAPAGNINHWDITRPGPQRGFDTAKNIGTVLGSAVLKACEQLEPVSSTPLKALSETIDLQLRKVMPSEIAASRKLLQTPPPPNVDFTLDRVNAKKIMAIGERNAEELHLEIQAISVGSVAFVGIPGELFVELGLEIVKESPFLHTYVLELANGNIGYIPTAKAFKEGGYEPTSSILMPSDGERIAEAAINLLRRLKAGQ